MTALTRDSILGAADLPAQDVAVPEWGGSVRVRGLTGDERDDFEASCVVGKGKQTTVTWKNARAKIVARCVIDDAGARVFSDGDVEALGLKSAAALNRVYAVAAKLS